MLGAIIGDVVGSRFEWNNCKSKDFELFTAQCRPTDDSIMSIAVAEAILASGGNKRLLASGAIRSMQKFGKTYPNAGYGGRFMSWLWEKDPRPYNSFGNGAAMRVSACGFAGSSLEDARALAKTVTEVTHNHEEGLKGADATTCAIYLARTGNSKEEIKAFLEDHFYKLNFTLDEIRPSYTFDVSCQGSVPQALVAFLESNSFEDAIRNAISIGGDSDTIAAITGSVAEAYYGIPEDILYGVLDYLDATQVEVLYHFEKAYLSRMTPSEKDSLFGYPTSVFAGIDQCVDKKAPEDIEIGTAVDPGDLLPDFRSFGDGFEDEIWSWKMKKK